MAQIARNGAARPRAGKAWRVRGKSIAVAMSLVVAAITAFAPSQAYARLGGDDTATGSYALNYAQTHDDGTYTGDFNTADGMRALLSDTTGSGNTASGWGALDLNTEGGSNTAAGLEALYNNTSGLENTAVGAFAGAPDLSPTESNTSGSDNTFLGFNSGLSCCQQLSNATALGANARVGESNALVLGGTGANAVKVGIGTVSPTSALTVVGTVQSTSGGFKFPDGTTQSTAGIVLAPGGWGTYLRSDGTHWTSSALLASDLSWTGTNTASGEAALQISSGNDNTADGEFALENSAGSNDVAVGSYALDGSGPGGDNTAVGAYAGYPLVFGQHFVLGSNDTFIGNDATVGTASEVDNSTAIGRSAVVSESNALVLGGTGPFAVNVGIGTSTPAYTLDVQGTIRATGLITGSISGNAGTVSNGVYTIGDQTIGGTKSFSNTIQGNISGSAAGFNTLTVGTATGTTALRVRAKHSTHRRAGAPTPPAGTLLQVGQASSSYGNYVQLPLVTSKTGPPAADCNSTTYVGRMILQADTTGNGKVVLWACSSNGAWQKVTGS